MPEVPLHIQDIIRHKRDGLALTDAEIHYFIQSLVSRTSTSDSPTDSQASALLMAIFLRGLSPAELAALTSAMRTSGEVFDASPLRTFTVDKHSTGGVGDKTSLLVAPILAAAGIAHPTPDGIPGICVPMISGRSLGHTGGTLDKLETIPGFNSQLSLSEFAHTLRTCGAALIGQTPTLVPADRILYALRDHTSTVESPFLITASIMSKKLAESLNALVLDVKTGSGAFMPTYSDSRLLARLMVETGTSAGTRTVALLTSHDQPLGRYAGNWLEVQECVDILHQRRHPLSADLIELTNLLSGWMLHLAGHADTPAAGAVLSDQILRSGAARDAFYNIIRTQGGDTSVFETGLRTYPRGTDPSQPTPPHPRQPEGNPTAAQKSASPIFTRTIRSQSSGFLFSMDCRQAGWAVQRLGAGRARPGDPVSAHAGIELHAKLGDALRPGQPLVTLFAEDPALLDEPETLLRSTLHVSPSAPTLEPLLRAIITSDSPI